MFNDRNLSRTQLISKLYGSICCLAMFSMLFGMQIFSMARDLRRGDPNHVVHWTAFSVIAMLAGIISSSLWIHGWIQRLAKLDSEQRPDSASR